MNRLRPDWGQERDERKEKLRVKEGEKERVK
jgi:hypothetical protein